VDALYKSTFTLLYYTISFWSMCHAIWYRILLVRVSSRICHGHKELFTRSNARIFALCRCQVLSMSLIGEPVKEIIVQQSTVIAVETPLKCSCCDTVPPADQRLRRCTRCYRTAYCNQSAHLLSTAAANNNNIDDDVLISVLP